MGNRFDGGIESGAMPWPNRYIGNPALTGVGRLLYGCPVRDVHCGLRGFSRDAFERMALQTSGMEYASEMVIKATLLEMRICEIPTPLATDGRSRRSHLRPWRDGWRHLKLMLKGSPKWVFLYPGVAMTLLGAILGVWLMITPIRIGSVVLDIHTLTYAAAMVCVGFQLVSVAILLRSRAVAMGMRPASGRLDRMVGVLSSRGMLIAAGGLCLVGVVGTSLAVLRWGAVTFGDLEAHEVMRLVVPSVAAMILAGQLLVIGMLLGTTDAPINSPRRPSGTSEDKSTTESPRR